MLILLFKVFDLFVKKMVVVTENDMYWVVDIIFLFLESSEYAFTSDNVECRTVDC